MTATAVLKRTLPVGGVERRSLGWWGVLCLIASEGALFAYLLFGYFYYAVQLPEDWMPRAHPSMLLALPNTVVLLLSSVAVWWGESALRRRGGRARLVGGLAVGIVLGIVFVVVQTYEWRSRTFSLSSSTYGSLYFTITGFHMAHVVVGIGALLMVLLWSALGYFDQRRNQPVLITAIYWHFVDAVWLCVFATFYITPYLR